MFLVELRERKGVSGWDLIDGIIPYSGNFSRGSMFCGFRRELFTAKRTREILNTCIQNILPFVPEVKQLSKKRSSVNKI